MTTPILSITHVSGLGHHQNFGHHPASFHRRRGTRGRTYRRLRPQFCRRCPVSPCQPSVVGADVFLILTPQHLRFTQRATDGFGERLLAPMPFWKETSR